MIYNITLNPSVDHRVFVNEFAVGETLSATRSDRRLAGKGINCSLVLEKCTDNFESVVLLGDYEPDLVNDSLKSKNTKTFLRSGKNRINLTIIESNGRSTHIRENIELDDGDSLLEIATYLKRVVQIDDVVVISGKSPISAKIDEIYNFVFQCCTLSKNVILDSESFSREEICALGISTLKINSAEFSKIFGGSLLGENDLKGIGSCSEQCGVSLIITLGVDGVIAVEQGAPPIRVLIDDDAKVVGSDAVGSGDSFLAGYVYSLAAGQSFGERLITATAFGIARQHSDGLDTIDVSAATISEISAKLSARSA